MRLDVKICGITNVDDAKVALDAGADFLGFVLYARSPRGISSSRLAELVGKVDAEHRAVGVFVNEDPGEVARVAAECGLAAVQIHGDEAEEGFVELPVPVWRALRMAGGQPVPDPCAWRAQRYVLDAGVPGRYGGTGRRTDWDAGARLARLHELMLAGGLDAENVAEAVRRVKPCGVDVSSGVEASVGRKDPEKVRRFIQRARAAACEA